MTKDPSNTPTCIRSNSRLQKLSQLTAKTISIQFRRYGALLLRGFSPTVAEFRFFTAQFCNYFIAYPGNKRGRVDENIQTVDMTKAEIPLHSELSYSPVRPDLAWFYCAVPPRVGGATTLCDGVLLATALPGDVRRWFEGKRLRFRAVLEPRSWQTMFACKTIRQAAEVICLRSYPNISIAGDKILIDHLTPPLAPTKYHRIAFCNNLLLHYGRSTDVAFTDNSVLPRAIYENVAQISARLTTEIEWQAGDVLMVDNTRFMHGRRSVLDNDRLILTRFGS